MGTRKKSKVNRQKSKVRCQTSDKSSAKSHLKNEKIKVQISGTLPIKESVLRKATMSFCRSLGIVDAELSFVFVAGNKMRRINQQFLGHDYVTDVITFDLKNPGTQDTGHRTQDVRHPGQPCASARLVGKMRCHLVHRDPDLLPVSCVMCPVSLSGEIIICPAEARRNANAYGEPFEREILRYIAHGLLHLVGFDDETAGQRRKMQEKENILLAALTFKSGDIK